MGETAWFACAAAVLHFWALIFVCARAPERRVLSPTFGSDDDKHVQEATSDDNDVGEDDSHDGTFLTLEEGTDRRPVDIVGVVRSSKHHKATKNNHTSTNKASSLAPIDTKLSGGSSICEPKKTKSTDFSADIPFPRRRSSGLSPVDCIIEGFDVATDFSTINVCRTVGSSPAPIALEDKTVSATQDAKATRFPGETLKLDPPAASDDDQGVSDESAIEVIDTPEITTVPSIIMSPAMKHHYTSSTGDHHHHHQQQQPSIVMPPALRQDF